MKNALTENELACFRLGSPTRLPLHIQFQCFMSTDLVWSAHAATRRDVQSTHVSDAACASTIIDRNHGNGWNVIAYIGCFPCIVHVSLLLNTRMFGIDELEDAFNWCWFRLHSQFSIVVMPLLTRYDRRRVQKGITFIAFLHIQFPFNFLYTFQILLLLFKNKKSNLKV